MPSPFWEFKPGNRPVAIAHRGGDAAGKDKQDTFEAFEAAWKLGIKFVEADVIRAASGEIVIVHGSHNWLHSSFGRDITAHALQMMTLDQIRYLIKPGGNQVALLEDVIGSFPKMKFVLDLKTTEVVMPLVRKLKAMKATERVCVSGYNYDRNLMFADACEPRQTSVGLTVGRSMRLQNMNMLMLKSGRLKGVETIFMHHSLISTPMVNLVHHRGFKVVVWTANSSLGIKHAIRSGVDGIISDRVDLLNKFLDQAKQQ